MARTTLNLDPELLRQAMDAGGYKTKRATVRPALELLVACYEQQPSRERKTPRPAERA
jgi:Arc/MetJ family transcription regulator